jgi:hypothetical protein
MARSVRRFAQRRGATITIVALSVGAILAMGALTVDLGMLFKIRNDAQRVADASALAGASAYQTYDPLAARPYALERALAFIDSNYVGGSEVDISDPQPPVINGNKWTVVASDATIEIAPDIYRVRVTIRRPNASSFFGRILGVTGTNIQAYAAAEAVNAGGAKCVRPFALADIWEEASSDGNFNNMWDTGEDWEYDPIGDPGDQYSPWDGTVEEEGLGPLQTGFGSEHRNNLPDPDGNSFTRDWGRKTVLKPQDPQVDQTIKAGHFFVWDMPDDPISTTECAKAGGSGAQDYEHNICECNDAPVYTDTEYDIKPGNMVGPTKQGFKELIAQDPAAKWVEGAPGERGYVENSIAGENWQDESPRVIKVALYDPDEEYKSGRISIKFNNIGLFFVDDYTRIPGDKEDAVIARFITYAKGSATPGPGGPLAKVLRLVE